MGTRAESEGGTTRGLPGWPERPMAPNGQDTLRVEQEGADWPGGESLEKQPDSSGRFLFSHLRMIHLLEYCQFLIAEYRGCIQNAISVYFLSHHGEVTILNEEEYRFKKLFGFTPESEVRDDEATAFAFGMDDSVIGLEGPALTRVDKHGGLRRPRVSPTGAN